MPSKKRVAREKKLEELLNKNTYSVFERDPALEHSILTSPSGTFQKPNSPRPKAPNFGFFDTELEALQRAQDANDYMEELLGKNIWAEKSQKYRAITLTSEFDGYKESAKGTPLLDEILNRHGRETALMVFNNMDELCEAVRQRGSYRVAYSNFWNLSGGGPTPMGTGNEDSLRVGEPAPRIDLDSSDSSSATSGTSGSRAPSET
ncbi:hypothetical protein FS837_012636 [Tulasnella sp. UAMH 9824]|nr:hypothetical protein FS837_012636 [Tulasnella sp. UAMH 9824]